MLDASAVLALLFEETGADVIRMRVRGALISTVNLAEVLAKLVDKGVPIVEAARAVDMLGMEAVPLSIKQAQLSGVLRASTRSAGLSVGDRACLALARDRGLPAVTAERRWPDLAKDSGVDVEVIR